MPYRHYKKLERCTFYSAPRTPIRPGLIPPGQEYLEIITGGVVCFGEKDDMREYRRGTIFWHQAGEKTVCLTSPEEPYRCLVCRFETDGSPREVPRIGMWSDHPPLDSFVEDMLYLSRNELTGSEEILLYSLGTLLRQMRIPTTKSLPPILRNACRIMDRDPAKNWDVELLARCVGVSKSRLFFLFKTHLDTSPHQYLLKRRISIAKELLSTRPDMPVKQIAESCGFSTIEIFYRRFHQHTNMTPVEYRKNF